jgi:diadenosine tetraphosphatase ApaH/serine/threonine PP2A family protein phosphatase
LGTEGKALRIRLISDIHGNLPALEKVLNHPAGLANDLTVCLGDITGYGPWPSECIQLVQNVCDASVAGNHDMGCVGLLPLKRFNIWGELAIRWSKDKLGDAEKSWLKELPLAVETHGIHGCHAYPPAPDSWEYILDGTSALAVFKELPGQTWFFGHTHSPCAWSTTGVRALERVTDLNTHPLVNCGSVGQPRDGNPRAAFTMVDTVENTAETIRVDYPVEVTVMEIRRAGLPAFLAERLLTGH